MGPPHTQSACIKPGELSRDLDGDPGSTLLFSHGGFATGQMWPWFQWKEMWAPKHLVILPWGHGAYLADDSAHFHLWLPDGLIPYCSNFIKESHDVQRVLKLSAFVGY